MKESNIAAMTINCVRWIQNFFEKNGKGCNAIVGISGGKDSSVVAALCVAALGKDRVIGVLMPDGEQTDIADSRTLVMHLGIRSVEINIHDAVEAVRKGVSLKLCDWSEQSEINLPARIRMATLYAVSQTMHGRVANTCNLSEDVIGYATRYGDSAGDFSPLGNMFTDEVVAVGEYLGLPQELTRKAPADGLCGKTDEDYLGFTYDALNQYLRTGTYHDEAIRNRMDYLIEKNRFKMQPMPTFYKLEGDIWNGKKI